jgi:hypothetical protein
MSKFIEVATKIVTLISLAIAVVAALYALPLDEKLKKLKTETERLGHETVRLDNSLKVSEAELKRLEASRELSLELYKEVKDVLSREKVSKREEEAIRVLVDSLAEDPFRWKLLKALARAVKDKDVQEKAETTATFYREEDQISVTPKPSKILSVSTKAYGKMRVDIFYCATTENISKPFADSAMELRDSSFIQRWRIRVLPEEINNRSGYNVHRNVIRYNPEEKTAAIELRDDLEAKMPNLKVDIMEIQYPTPNYLSVFFCS